MAKVYDEEEIKNLEKQAALKQRQDAAMKILSTEKPNPAETLRANEERRREAYHQQLMAAHQRFNDSHAMALVNDPGRASPYAVKAAEKWLEGRGFGQEGERRRQFDETQKAEQFKAEQETAGKIGYGKDAEAIRSAANKEISQTEWGTRAKIAEGEIAAKKILGEMESKDRRYAIDAEHGVIGPDGKVTPGSRERMAQVQGESEIKKQEAANKGLLAQAEIQRQNKEREIAAQIEKAQIEAGSNADAAKNTAHAKIIAAAIQSGALRGKDTGTVLGELTDQYKDDPEMLSSIKAIVGGGKQQQQPTGGKIEKGTKKTFPNGDVGVWDGTKWVKEG